MELAINWLSDITYMPELTQHLFDNSGAYKQISAGLIRTITYSPSTADRKLCAH